MCDLPGHLVVQCQRAITWYSLQQQTTPEHSPPRSALLASD
jgi:hypothetical protein